MIVRLLIIAAVVGAGIYLAGLIADGNDESRK